MSVRKQPPLPKDWAVIELPSTDAELLKQTRKPEEVSKLPVTNIMILPITPTMEIRTDGWVFLSQANLNTRLKTWERHMETVHVRKG